jgi:2'-5' RNA ligase
MIKKFTSMITENRKNKFGCAMVYFDLPIMEMIHNFIDEEDIYEDPDDDSYGLEDEPHVTLLFGLHEEVKDEEVMELSTPNEFTPIILKNASCFKTKQGYSVLKFEAEADWLHECNKKLSELPHTNNFPDYKPHCTLAYMKNDKCEKYIEILKGVEIEVTPKQLIYSKISGKKVKSDIN